MMDGESAHDTGTHPVPLDRNRELEGKVAIVTGSARNIGRTIAEELALAGAKVVINAVSARETCEEVAQAIVSRGGEAIPLLADIGQQDDVDRLVATTVQALGGVDILVNNAAVRARAPFTELTFEDWARLRTVALDGCFRMSLACVPHIIRRGGGAVIGIHGMNSYAGGASGAHKAAVKCGMAGMMRAMAQDLGPHNITCNVAVVGQFETERDGASGGTKRAPAAAGIPMGRNGRPQDMADLVRFLCGPYARYITGQTIHVNGGALMPH